MKKPTFPWFLNFFLVFLSTLAPLMFVVGVISGLDRWNTYRRLRSELEASGLQAEGFVSYRDDENSRIGVDYLDQDGRQRYGALEMRYYNTVGWEQFVPGAPVNIRYIPEYTSISDQVVLVEAYDDFLDFFPAWPDVFGILGVAWLVLMARPQILFWGLVDGEKLMSEALQ